MCWTYKNVHCHCNYLIFSQLYLVRLFVCFLLDITKSKRSVWNQQVNNAFFTFWISFLKYTFVHPSLFSASKPFDISLTYPSILQTVRPEGYNTPWGYGKTLKISFFLEFWGEKCNEKNTNFS